MKILDLPLDLLNKFCGGEPVKTGRFEKLLLWASAIVIVIQIGLIVAQVWFGL